MRIYGELAPWFHLLTHPSDYAEEAAYYTQVIDAVERRAGAHAPRARLRRRQQRVTPEGALRLHAHRSLAGDARAEPDDQPGVRARPGRHAHASARSHVRRRFRPRRDHVHDDRGRPPRRDRDGRCPCCAGRRRLLVPDTTREIFAPGIDHGGHDGDDGRALRYLEWTYDPDPDATTFEVDFAVILREPDESCPRRARPPHVRALPTRRPGCACSRGRARPRRGRRRAPVPGGAEVFVAPVARLDAVREGVYPLATNIRSSSRLDLETGDPNAHDTTTGDLAVPRRVRGRARIPADRARDRRRGRSRLAFDCSRAPRKSRARRSAPPRPDQAARDRARRPAARRGAHRGGRPRSCRSSAGSPPAGRCSPSRRSRSGSPFPSPSVVMPTSSFGSRANR